MAEQFVAGALSAYVNTIYYPTAEDVAFKMPYTSNTPAESNQGPLSAVVTWNKETGTLNFTILHYSGCDFVNNFASPAGYNITLNGRAGDQLVAKDAYLTEAPNHNQQSGQTELAFGCLNMTYTMAPTS